MIAQGILHGIEFPEWSRRLWQLAGAGHPLVVHFPIALLLASALLEVISIWKGENVRLRFAIVANMVMGTIGAVVAAALGWIDATQIHFEPDLRAVLTWHRWLGTSSAIGAVVVTVLWFGWARNGSPRRIWIYRVALWLLALGVSVCAHWGGLLVYGLDYFSPT